MYVCLTEVKDWSCRRSFKIFSKDRCTQTFALLCFFLCFLVVVDASLTFYNATTTILLDKDQPNPTPCLTSTLNTTIHPEEKRQIIGDTFIKVADQICKELNLNPLETVLAQGETSRLHHVVKSKTNHHHIMQNCTFCHVWPRPDVMNSYASVS